MQVSNVYLCSSDNIVINYSLTVIMAWGDKLQLTDCFMQWSHQTVLRLLAFWISNVSLILQKKNTSNVCLLAYMACLMVITWYSLVSFFKMLTLHSSCLRKSVIMCLKSRQAFRQNPSVFHFFPDAIFKYLGQRNKMLFSKIMTPVWRRTVTLWIFNGILTEASPRAAFFFRFHFCWSKSPAGRARRSPASLINMDSWPSHRPVRILDGFCISLRRSGYFPKLRKVIFWCLATYKNTPSLKTKGETEDKSSSVQLFASLKTNFTVIYY